MNWWVRLLATLACLVFDAPGEELPKHWAFQPVSVKAEKIEAGQNPIDVFVAEKLDSIGYRAPVYPATSSSKQGTVASKLSPEADRRTLIRRLSFDLHGLPPSPRAVERFVNDRSPDAYEKLVDKMLASPHYGERYARHWLDIAHYADTHGFERDKRRPSAWRYRDYVIDAFNSDKPYDRFLKEQIAGDVLFPEVMAASIATGFLAAGPWDFVGHVETKSPILRRAARAFDLDDMTNQVMTATMGMTVNCARCHDHKLDPISREEYFQLTAVFAGVKRGERSSSEASLRKYTEKKSELTGQRNAIAHRIGQLEGKGIDLADIVGGGNGRGSGIRGNGIDPRNAVVQTRKFGELGNVKVNHFAKSKFDFVDGVFIADGVDGKTEIPVTSTGIKISGIPQTNGKAWDHIRNGPVGSQHSNVLGGIDFTRDGHTLLGLHANAGITFDLDAIRKATGDKEMRFVSQLGYFGAVGVYRADAWIYLDGVSVASFKHLKRADGLQLVDIPVPVTARFLTLLATDGENGYSMDQVGFGDPRLKPAVPMRLSAADNAELIRLRETYRKVDRKIEVLGDPPRFYGVVAHKAMPPVRVHRRGDPESETGDPLPPGALNALTMLDPELGAIDSTESERRKALAEWITDPKNPLTARVIVNRLWHWHFGQGIVNTPSDFGSGGGRPSHPELLDWLAAELVRHDWSLKAMHRLILTSQTFRQISSYPEDHPGVTIDSANRFLWRQNPGRIEAEAIRDAVLFVSGKLNGERGGPGFEDFTYREAYAPEYTYITADEPKLWRRSIYRYIVRTTPSRFLTTLDCPDPANLTPKRLTTTTPLQSLALYNNEFILKQAGYFADRLKNETGNEVSKQIRQAFRYAFGREPEEVELELAAAFIKSEGLPAFCRTLFNANEFVYVD